MDMNQLRGEARGDDGLNRTEANHPPPDQGRRLIANGFF
jgi:hypothetical protein